MLKCLWEKFFLVFVSFILVYGCMGEKNIEPLVYQKCGLCHRVEVALSKKRTPEEWKKIIYAMKLRGLKLSEEDEMVILSFLNKYYCK